MAIFSNENMMTYSSLRAMAHTLRMNEGHCACSLVVAGPMYCESLYTKPKNRSVCAVGHWERHENTPNNRPAMNTKAKFKNTFGKSRVSRVNDRAINRPS